MRIVGELRSRTAVRDTTTTTTTAAVGSGAAGGRAAGGGLPAFSCPLLVLGHSVAVVVVVAVAADLVWSPRRRGAVSRWTGSSQARTSEARLAKPMLNSSITRPR